VNIVGTFQSVDTAGDIALRPARGRRRVQANRSAVVEAGEPEVPTNRADNLRVSSEHPESSGCSPSVHATFPAVADQDASPIVKRIIFITPKRDWSVLLDSDTLFSKTDLEGHPLSITSCGDSGVTCRAGVDAPGAHLRNVGHNPYITNWKQRLQHSIHHPLDRAVL